MMRHAVILGVVLQCVQPGAVFAQPQDALDRISLSGADWSIHE
jgi:hypothetical protein